MTENEFDRTARVWLEEGPSVMPDRGLQAALAEIHLTRQRRAWWPARRIFQMNAPIRVAVGAAAVIVAGVIGLRLLPGGSSIGGPGPTPAATPTPAPTPSPIALPMHPGWLTATKPGRYLIGAPFKRPATVTLPAGWGGKVGAGTNGVPTMAVLGTTGHEDINLLWSLKFYADPCTNGGLLSPQPGPTADDLAAALAALPGFTATTPTSVTLGGYSGKRISLTAPDSFAKCTLPSDGYRLFELSDGALVWTFSEGERMDLWILDVNGERIVVALAHTGQSATELTEAQGVIDSLAFEPTN